MASGTLQSTKLAVLPLLKDESCYVGIDIGKHSHVAGFVSTTLLRRHERFEGCPALAFDNTREGFRRLVDRMQTYVPLEQCFVLMEKTGHYHKALEEYLLDLDIAVHVMHVRERQHGMLKTDKRDALGLANHLYNQLEKGIQVANRTELVRRARPPTAAATLLRGLIGHRSELIKESTRRKNKLTSICDQLFPEFTRVCKDPNLPSALAIRAAFPTPRALSLADLDALCTVRVGHQPSRAKLAALQRLAVQTIGVRDGVRQRSLTFEQAQLIRELTLLQEHIRQLDREIMQVVAQAREGRILTSIPGVGPIHAATIIAAIGTIDNFPNAAALKSYCGWAPTVAQTGVSMDRARLSPTGTRSVKQMLYLIVANAIQQDCEWARLYERLVPLKCSYDERKRTYIGKTKVMGRVAGQMISLMYLLLKTDAEVLSRTPRGEQPPEPLLYDAAVHHAHRHGAYRSSKPPLDPGIVTALPKRCAE